MALETPTPILFLDNRVLGSNGYLWLPTQSVNATSGCAAARPR